MKNKILHQSTFVDKTKWPRGEWDNEPDKLQWIDAATGLDCLIVRQPQLGHLCGYVGVAKGHPAFEKGYGDVDVDVHGGLTFADFCMEKDPEHGVCHVAEPGRPERVWWLGFDCAHLADLSPGMIAGLKNAGLSITSRLNHDVYRNVEYVRAECAKLAQQLVAMK